MTANEFLYDRCDEDARGIIQTYLMLNYGCDFKVSDLDNKMLVDFDGPIITFLTLCQLASNSKIGKLFKRFDIHMEDYFNFDNVDIREMKRFLFDGQLYPEYAELFLSKSDYAASLIRAFAFNINGVVTAEEIVYNMVNDSINEESVISRLWYDNKVFRILKSDEFIAELKELVLDKGTIINKPKKNKQYNFKYGEILNDRRFINDPAVGRDKEMKELIISLASPNKSAIITGPAGVGKTALVEGFAYRLQKGDVPSIFRDKKILAVTSSQLVGGCSYVGEFEEKTEEFLMEVVKNPEIVLFIDEVHTAIGTGQGENGGNDLAQILKPYLDRGKIKMIGSTTEYEYEKLILGDEAFKRRFERVKVLEPKDEVLKRILFNRIECFEEELGIKFFYNSYVRESIIDSIIKITAAKRRDIMDIAYNPDLATSILERAFGLAIYDGNSSVTLPNAIEAISGCERVYSMTRENEIKKLKSTFEYEEDGTFAKTKVIEFRPQAKVKR